MNGLRTWLKIVVILTALAFLATTLAISIAADGNWLEASYWRQDFILKPGWIIRDNNTEPVSLSLRGSSYFKLVRNNSDIIEAQAMEPTDFHGATYYTLDVRLNQSWLLVSDDYVEGTLQSGGSIRTYPSSEKSNEILLTYSRYGLIAWLAAILASLGVINLLNRNSKPRRLVPSEL